MKMTKWAALGAVVGLIASPLGSFADHHEQPGLLAKVWTFIPKNGSEAKFDKAFAEHVQWRRDNKDPWNWEIYVQVDGPEVGARYARSGNHHWSDFDAYDASEFSKKATQHWSEHVAPHLEDIRSEINKWNPDVSNWPPDSPEYNLFGLHRHLLKIGGMQKFLAAVGAISATLKEGGWPYHWGFTEALSGEGPTVMLVLPSVNWAAMEDPDPSIWDTMVKVAGEEKSGKMWDDLYATVRRVETVIVRRIPELTVEAAK